MPSASRFDKVSKLAFKDKNITLGTKLWRSIKTEEGVFEVFVLFDVYGITNCHLSLVNCQLSIIIFL